MTAEKTQATGLKGWIGYRPEIKVLDVTVRDGGLMNDHKFSHDFVRAVYQANVAAGVDYMEIGYKSSKKMHARDKFGCWKFCDEDDMRRIIGDTKSSVKISVMADAERTDYKEDILPKGKTVVDMVRVASYIHQIPSALDMIKDAHDKGHETTINLMAVSTVPEVELDNALEILCKSEVETIYIVDSFGTLYSEQVQYLMHKFLKFTKPAKKEIGIHTHNNMQLGYANTIEAIILGANLLDASFAGLGRGAGNCQLELLLSFLHNPKFNLRPVIECVQNHVEPMREKLRWGFAIPYMITGYLNQHPRAAMEFMEAGDGKDVVKFFDSVTDED
ncbi:MAG: nucleoid-structuring protein H-NS [Verrucomicrobiae bacterium]|nr:nucleoid-structuring protein H-NS [Verrucomicrobiae bacterium]